VATIEISGTVIKVEATRNITDLQRAIALLSLDHSLLEASAAIAYLDLDETALIERLQDEIPELEILKAIGKEIGIRFFDLYSSTPEFEVSDEVLRKVEMNFLKRFNALPLADKQGRVVVAAANPGDIEMVDYLRSRYPLGFALVLSSRTQIQNRLAFYSSSEIIIPGLKNNEPQRQEQSAVRSNIPREVVSGRSPVQDWVEGTLSRAVSESASDVHFMINPDKTLLLRFRIDGILMGQRIPQGIRPLEAIGALVARCDTMDSANYKEPQDGTFTFEAAGRQIDARVAMMPQLHGPTLVIRLLDTQNMGSKLDDMGFSPDHLVTIRKIMGLSQGTILTVGPTGAGKTTTLWGMMREVDANLKHVQTVENPVEYRLPLIGQTEIRPGLGDRSITFARALRTVLRLDPDIVLVGEIRDAETAEVTIQAAITGHLVLSTLHANSAVAAFPRLINMGVANYLASEAIDLIISQRLLRRVHECAEYGPPTREEEVILTRMGFPIPEQTAKPKGCPTCRGTGYRGRVAAAEVLTPNRSFRDAVIHHATNAELLDIARENGFKTIAEDGYRHVVEGRTTPVELMRVLLTEGAD
jgi:type IV pilus assembly protein PilB